MNTVRLNITLPKELGKELTRIANKSAFIAEALQEKLFRRNKERQLRELKEAYRQTNLEEAQLRKNWDQILADD